MFSRARATSSPVTATRSGRSRPRARSMPPRARNAPAENVLGGLEKSVALAGRGQRGPAMDHGLQVVSHGALHAVAPDRAQAQFAGQVQHGQGRGHAGVFAELAFHQPGPASCGQAHVPGSPDGLVEHDGHGRARAQLGVVVPVVRTEGLLQKLHVVQDFQLPAQGQGLVHAPSRGGVTLVGVQAHHHARRQGLAHGPHPGRILGQGRRAHLELEATVPGPGQIPGPLGRRPRLGTGAEGRQGHGRQILAVGRVQALAPGLHGAGQAAGREGPINGQRRDTCLPGNAALHIPGHLAQNPGHVRRGLVAVAWQGRDLAQARAARAFQQDVKDVESLHRAEGQPVGLGQGHAQDMRGQGQAGSHARALQPASTAAYRRSTMAALAGPLNSRAALARLASDMVCHRPGSSLRRTRKSATRTGSQPSSR